MQHINLNGDNKYFLEFKICKKSDVEFNNCDFTYFKMPYFYLDTPKPESILGYKLLYYLYFKKFNKYLDISEIILDDNNKPCFGNTVNNNLYFNISHSKNFVACVLSNFDVGLDIEEERAINHNACKRFINSHDYSYMLEHKYFEIQVWNIKEAYAKYLGLGLRLNFKDVYVKNIINNYNTVINSFYIENHKIFLAICFNKSIKLN